MSWVIKILLRDFTKVNKEWNGSEFTSDILSKSDYMINDFQFSESTWREVSFSAVEEEDLINRIETSDNIILSSNSKRYQFINPLVEEVIVRLPLIPKFNQRYIIKNLSEVNNKLLIKQTLQGPTLFTLDSTDEYTSIFHDGVEYHCQI